MRNYLKEHFPQLNIQLTNAGKSSETVSGLSEPYHPGYRPCIHERLGNVIAANSPDITFVCYAMV